MGAAPVADHHRTQLNSPCIRPGGTCTCQPEDMIARFPAAMRQRIAGVIRGRDRHQSILNYVCMNDVERFAVLDDSSVRCRRRIWRRLLRKCRAVICFSCLFMLLETGIWPQLIGVWILDAVALSKSLI